MLLRRFILALVLFCAAAGAAPGVIVIDDDSNHTVNTTTPGDNSGWQYQGYFAGYNGTPIAPYFFMTAQHIGGFVGLPFIFHGETFTTTAVFNDPSTDLRIWQVDHPFPTYAPLYQVNGGEAGQELRVFGRGTQRGAEMYLGGKLRGWARGTPDNAQRWGRNAVAAIVPLTTGSPWFFLQADFDFPGLIHEAHLSDGDSGGGVFILEDGLWRLAAVNYGVDQLFTASDGSGAFIAAIFDATGYYYQATNASGQTVYPQVQPNADGSNVPVSFYSTQVASRMTWIKSVIDGNFSPLPVDPAVLPAESFAAWQHAYFTPTEISNAVVSGPTADPDGDGVANLLEFAFNLDPTFAEPTVMTPGTGLRGLPLTKVEQVSATDRRLTVEFVRRTTGSGAGLTYTAQFSAAPGANANWQTGGTASATPINARWERVKVTDTVSIDGTTPVRFARVAVTQAAP